MPIQGRAALTQALQSLGEVLAHRGETVAVAVIGGSGLLLLRILDRPTRDVDLVARVEAGELLPASSLPPGFQEAVAAVAADLGLEEHWINAGPDDLLRFGLPAGFLDRCQPLQFAGLIVWVASRFDQVHFKLYAAVDQGPQSKHYADLLLLAPTVAELLEAARWCRTHDPSEPFRDSLRQTLHSLGVEAHDL
ncbi:MAG: hypothetical protein EYC70_05285 [Planctomycetota bacterium]|nr:MAG: hypothetical protein EYC70_05285 [Planctomycetota bacterium]